MKDYRKVVKRKKNSKKPKWLSDYEDYKRNTSRR